MATKLTAQQAYKVAGQLYGSLLLRDSDEAGFKWASDNLIAGTLSVRDLVRELVCSEEFREKFLMNDTPNEISRKVREKLLGERRLNGEGVKATAVSLLERDWREVMVELVNSAEYTQLFGDDTVPG